MPTILKRVEWVAFDNTAPLTSTFAVIVADLDDSGNAIRERQLTATTAAGEGFTVDAISSTINADLAIRVEALTAEIHAYQANGET